MAESSVTLNFLEVSAKSTLAKEVYPLRSSNHFRVSSVGGFIANND